MGKFAEFVMLTLFVFFLVISFIRGVLGERYDVKTEKQCGAIHLLSNLPFFAISKRTR